MRRLILIASLASACLAVAACDNTKRLSEPLPTPTASPQAEPATGDPCGDGTVLRPHEQCP